MNVVNLIASREQQARAASAERYYSLVRNHATLTEAQAVQLHEVMQALKLDVSDLSRDIATGEKFKEALTWTSKATEIEKTMESTAKAATDFNTFKRAKIAELEREHVRLGSAATAALNNYMALQTNKNLRDQLRASHPSLLAGIE